MNKFIFTCIIMILSFNINAQYTKVDKSITMSDVFFGDVLKSVSMIVSYEKVNFIFQNIPINSTTDIMITFIHGDPKKGVQMEMDYVDLTTLDNKAVLTPNVINLEKDPKKVKDSDIILVYVYDQINTYAMFKISGIHYKECVNLIKSNNVSFKKQY